MTFEEDFPSLRNKCYKTYDAMGPEDLSKMKEDKIVDLDVPVQDIIENCLDKQKVRDALFKVAEEYDIKFVDKILKELGLE